MNEFNQKLKGLAGRKITTSDFKIKDTKYNKKYFENRRNELAEIFNSVKADLQEQADFFSPNAVRFLARNVNKPRVRSKKIKDSTTLIAVRNFSSGMMTGATSPTRRWFKTGLMNKDVENNHAVKEWCAKQAELTRKILYASNFYQLLPEVYDADAVGDIHNKVHVVFYKKHGKVEFVVYAADEGGQLLGLLRVHARSGLVEQQKRGLCRQRARYLKLALLAVG